MIQQKYSFNFNKFIHIQQKYSFNFNKFIHIQQKYSFNFNKFIHIQQKYSFNFNKNIHIQQKYSFNFNKNIHSTSTKIFIQEIPWCYSVIRCHCFHLDENFEKFRDCKDCIKDRVFIYFLCYYILH
jgi:hypothetical protein